MVHEAAGQDGRFKAPFSVSAAGWSAGSDSFLQEGQRRYVPFFLLSLMVSIG
jgi:hypothetical protein